MNWQVFINSFYQGYGRRLVFSPFYISKADFILLFAHVRNKDTIIIENLYFMSTSKQSLRSFQLDLVVFHYVQG